MQPPSDPDRPDETRAAPSEGAAPYQPSGPVDSTTTPYGYPPQYSPDPSAQPGYPPAGQPYYPPAYPSEPYGQPGQPSQYGQPGQPSQYGQYGQYGAPAPMSGQYPQYPGYGQPAPMSGQYPGYGQPPNQYPGPAYPSMPLGAQAGYGAPPPRRRRVWPWIVGGVGALLILCCVLGVVGAAFLGNSPLASVATPAATATATATDTPIPTATVAKVVPGPNFHMVLGHNYKKTATGDLQIVSPTNVFKSSDEFAFVIRLPSSIGTTHVTLGLTLLQPGGLETVEYIAPMSISNPQDNEFANKISTADLMSGLAPGVYKLALKTSKTVASADFTYEG